MSQPTDRPALPPDPPLRPQETPAVLPRRELPRYKLVLHHDAAHELMFVVRTIMELTRFCRAEATHKMWESYHRGRSTLLLTYRERGELLIDQFAGKGLTVTLESE